MSANVVNKLDIDVLVHVAVYGPAGADGWRRLDDQPDESGRALWLQNWERAGYEGEDRPPIENYTFEPLPFAITVGEAFAHVATSDTRPPKSSVAAGSGLLFAALDRPCDRGHD